MFICLVYRVSYRAFGKLGKCQFLLLIVRMAIRCKVRAGGWPISCVGLTKVTGYGRSYVLVDRSHVGRLIHWLTVLAERKVYSSVVSTLKCYQSRPLAPWIWRC